MALLDGLVFGLAAARMTGGQFRRLAHVRIRFEGVFLGCMAIQLVASNWVSIPTPDVVALWALWVIPAAVASVIAALNLRTRGMYVVLAGLCLNLWVVLANAGMPVLVEAGTIVGMDTSAMHARLDASWLHVPASSATRWLVFADVIPLPGPAWHASVISLGDVLLSAGVGYLLFCAMHAGELEGQSKRL